MLFGGETLNDFFLNILSSFEIKFNDFNKCNNKTLKMNAIGVSCNQDYMTIINKIQMFDYIIFRSMKDFLFFNKYVDCKYCPDIIMMLKPMIQNNIRKTLVSLLTRKKRKIFGFFLSQTFIFNKNKQFIDEYLNTFVLFIQFLIENNFTIAIFPMCVNNIESECDLIINLALYNLLSVEDKKNVILYTSSTDILKNSSTLTYSLCWRYHAHILSIIHRIPFISISDTPKVTALLEDNKLQDLHCDVKNNIDNLMQCYYKIKFNTTYIKHKLSQVYKQCHLYAKTTYSDRSIYICERTNERFYLHDNDIKQIYDTVINTYLSYNLNLISVSDKTMLIIFSLMRTLHNEYSYGLCKKIEQQSTIMPTNNIQNIIIKEDIIWLINDCIFKKNAMFYEVAKSIIKVEVPPELNTIASKNKYQYNYRFIDQDIYKNIHRSGWSYVVENLNKINNSHGSAVLCDLYVDRTFHWNNNEYSLLKIIPYVKPWIGFIHHTCETDYSDHNTTYLFKNNNFIKSLECCKGLYVLSNYLKISVETLLLAQSITHVKVFELTHPTEFVEKTFDIKTFSNKNNNTRKIIQIGSWLRDLNAINQLDLKYNELTLQKCVLECKNMNNYLHVSEIIKYNKCQLETNISCDNKSRQIILNEDVLIIENLNNDDYDTLLSNNIVFIKLINASAVNTIIECIVRNTPILVNRLPATIELLGETYPLFYNTLDEASDLLTMKNIKKGYKYLKNLDKTKFKIETFINNLLRKG